MVRTAAQIVSDAHKRCNDSTYLRKVSDEEDEIAWSRRSFSHTQSDDHGTNEEAKGLTQYQIYISM